MGPLAIVRVMARDAFAFHIRYLVHCGFFVAGVADFFFGQGKRDGGLPVSHVHNVTDGTRVREIEMDRLSLRLFRVAGQAFTAFGDFRMIGTKYRRTSNKAEQKPKPKPLKGANQLSPARKRWVESRARS